MRRGSLKMVSEVGSVRRVSEHEQVRSVSAVRSRRRR